MMKHMKNSFIVRRANIRDLKDVLRLNFELFKKEYQEFDRSLSLNWTYTEGKKYFKDRIIKKDGFVEVVENRGKIIGYLCGGISKGLPFRKKARYAELENTLIIKRFRGKGLGAKLTRNFVDWCKGNKIDYITVTASSRNKASINFYRNLGFRDYDLVLEINLTKRK